MFSARYVSYIHCGYSKAVAGNGITTSNNAHPNMYYIICK